MKRKKMVCIAGMFGLFQALMPLIGWTCVHTIVEYFQVFEKFIPWIALILLSIIGGNMIAEGFHHQEKEDSSYSSLTLKLLLIQAVATSIDALSVGFTIADYNWLMAFVCSVIIAAVTFVLCMIGLVIGKKFGTMLSHKAEIFGGVILIVIGFEIFINNIL